MTYRQPTWRDREARILTALAEAESEGLRPSLDELVARSGLNPLVAQLGLEALLDGSYVTGINTTTHDGFDYMNLRLLPEGRKLIGDWPSPGSSSLGSDAALDIFISHSSRDADAARALVELCRAAMELSASRIRCTSVDGYRLPGGADAIHQLRQEIFGSRCFVGLISRASLESDFVLFELGARWGSQRSLIPIVMANLRPGDLPSPLSSLNALDGTQEAQLIQAISDVAVTLQCNLVPGQVWYQHLRNTHTELSRPGRLRGPPSS